MWAWALLLLDYAGPHMPVERADLFATLLGGLVGIGLVLAARTGWLPGTRRVVSSVALGVRRWLARLEPPSGIAFRLPRTGGVGRDRSRAGLGLFFALAILVLLAVGPRLLAGIDWLRTDGPYAAFVLAVLLLWAIFGAVTLVAVVLARSGRPPHPRRIALRLFAGWLLVVVLLGALPGWVAFTVFALAVALPLLRVAAPTRGRYYLYRRGPAGLRAITVDGWLRSSFALLALALLSVVALAAAPRWGHPLAPRGPYALTLGLGLSATVAALYAVLRSGSRLVSLLAQGRHAPERPLVPTVWWPEVRTRPDAAARPEPAPRWVLLARTHGFAVDRRRRSPPGGYDLVVQDAPDPRRFVPDPDLDDDTALFRLERRFHVVMRRAFFRGMRLLVRGLGVRDAPPGAGYLLCPHAWPVPAVIRDGGGPELPERPDSAVGGALVGLPYTAVFEPRVRRYVGGVLRALDLDVIWWEDRVPWPALRAVLRVLFETWDQGRHPALERHFVGIARVRVTIQDPDVDEEGYLDPLPDLDDDPALPLRARALVVRRDEGGSRDEAADRAPSTRRPEPVTV